MSPLCRATDCVAAEGEVNTATLDGLSMMHSHHVRLRHVAARGMPATTAPTDYADNRGMQDSVALLLAARSGLAEHDDEQQVVADLCQSFGVDADDATATVFAPKAWPHSMSRGVSPIT